MRLFGFIRALLTKNKKSFDIEFQLDLLTDGYYKIETKDQIKDLIEEKRVFSQKLISDIKVTSVLSGDRFYDEYEDRYLNMADYKSKRIDELVDELYESDIVLYKLENILYYWEEIKDTLQESYG